jgi:hypothetical protein
MWPKITVTHLGGPKFHLAAESPDSDGKAEVVFESNPGLVSLARVLLIAKKALDEGESTMERISKHKPD